MAVELSPLEHAIKYSGERADGRGLVSLSHARALVEAADEFVEGDPQIINGLCVCEYDLLWAALLSLETPAEFLRHAQRVKWRFHVRGRENTAVLQRYGAEVCVEWVESCIDTDSGILINTPWCLLANLMAAGTERAFEIACRIRHVYTSEQPSEHTFPYALDPDVNAVPILSEWIKRHADVGYRLVLPRAVDDRRLQRVLFTLTEGAPEVAFSAMCRAVGEEEAERAVATMSLRNCPLGDRLRRIIRKARHKHVLMAPPVAIGCMNHSFVDAVSCPTWDSREWFTGGMRVTGFTSKSGDALVFQTVVTGTDDASVRLEFHAYGSTPAFGALQVLHSPALELVREDELVSVDYYQARATHAVSGATVEWTTKSDLPTAVAPTSEQQPQRSKPAGSWLSAKDTRIIAAPRSPAEPFAVHSFHKLIAAPNLDGNVATLEERDINDIDDNPHSSSDEDEAEEEGDDDEADAMHKLNLAGAGADDEKEGEEDERGEEEDTEESSEEEEAAAPPPRKPPAGLGPPPGGPPTPSTSKGDASVEQEPDGSLRMSIHVRDSRAVTAALRARIGPSEGLAVAMCSDPATRDRVFLSTKQLARRLGLPGKAFKLFQFDEWYHPPHGELASSSEDLVLMVEALRLRQRITRLAEPKARRSHGFHLQRRLDTVGGFGDPVLWGEATNGNV